MNPYDRNNFPGKFLTTYVGKRNGFHVFCVETAGHNSMDAHMFEVELCDWVLTEAHGLATVGRSFSDPYPVDLNGNENGNLYVVLQRLVDVVNFENSFEVKGLTPSLLLPMEGA